MSRRETARGDSHVDARACAHTEVELLNPWDLLRKYVCTACGAVMTCACDEDIATLVLPHQAHHGNDPVTAERVAVTHPLTTGVCFDCRGVTPPAYPRSPHRGASSVVHRYYWHELFTRSQRDFIRWARDNGLPLVDGDGQSRVFELRGEYAAEADAIETGVLQDLRAWHASDPRYDTSRTSDADILDAAEVTTLELRAAYLTPSPGPRALVVPVGTVDATAAVSVEEFAAEYYRRQGREVLVTESRPFQCLFGCFMWLWVSDPADERNGLRFFGGRDGVGADENGLIPLFMPDDFGGANHANRRAEALQAHLDSLPNETAELLWNYDYWLEPSRPLRQYLWAYTAEDEERGRKIIEILGARRVKDILAFLAGDYWTRYLGWPDLLTWRGAQPAADEYVGEQADREHAYPGSDPLFVEVKSSSDRLSEDQRTWITLNHETLRFPFELAKVHRADRLHL